VIRNKTLMYILKDFHFSCNVAKLPVKFEHPKNCYHKNITLMIHMCVHYVKYRLQRWWRFETLSDNVKMSAVLRQVCNYCEMLNQVLKVSSGIWNMLL